jgi:hypothetical protein
VGEQEGEVCGADILFAKSKGRKVKTKAGRRTRLSYSPQSFVSPAIIIDMPDARITAANTASRKSHCFILSLFFSNWLLCVTP